jgi:dienelactone hydrolase
VKRTQNRAVLFVTISTLVLALALLAAQWLVLAQDKEVAAFNSGYDSYLPELLIAAETKCTVPATGWARKRQQVMEGLVRTLGKDLPRQWPSLNAKVEGVVTRPGYKVEQVSAEFWPGVRYAIQVYVPDGKGPFPGVVMAATGRNGPRHPLYQQLGGGFARMGILVVGILPLGKGVQNEAYQYNGIALLVGSSIAQEQFHTGDRALDYLLSRPDVDPKRIGMTGDSDGGWTTLYVATFDPRIKAAAPASTNYTFTGWLLPDRWKTNDHAEGNAPEVLTYGANIPILAATNAPKWFHFLNSGQESERLQYIPIIDGAARAAYEYAGVPHRYSSHVAPCPHGLWPVMQIEDISWFCQVFFGRRPAGGTLTLRKVPRSRFEQLLVKHGSGQAEAITVIEQDQQQEWKRLQVGELDDDGGKPAFLQIIETRRQDARAARQTLAKEPVRLKIELMRCLGLNGLDLKPRVVAQGGTVLLETEPGLKVLGAWVKDGTARSEAVTLVVGRTPDRERERVPGSFARFDLVMREEKLLGAATWAQVMLNRPPLGMWAWDAVSAARYLKQQGFKRVELLGVGETGGIIAILAGTLSQDVNAVRVVGNGLISLDEDVVGRRTPNTPYWAHRLLWVADLPELTALLKKQRRWVETKPAG